MDGLNLFVSHPRVVDLPEEGCITFRFRRGPAMVKEPFKGTPGSASVDLTLLEICDVKDEAMPSDDKSGRRKSEETIDKLFEEAREDEEEDDEEEGKAS